MVLEKYSEVIGLPVICIDNGKKIGIVEDVIFCPRFKVVKAFLLERRGCQVTRKVILLEDVANLGKDALIVGDCSCATDLRKVRDNEGFRDKGAVTGLRVYSKTGDDLGVVKDVLFDYKTGLIEGVEISDGLFQDILQGRKILPLFGKVEFSAENILVDKEALEEIMSSGGGLKKLLNE